MLNFCTPPPYRHDSGDLGALCLAGIAPDGGYGQGSCAAGEVCGLAFAYVTMSGFTQQTLSQQPFGCQIPCSAEGTCNQGVCFANPAAEPDDVCVAACDPTLAGECGGGAACVPLTPSTADPGVCWPACRGDFDCAGAQVCNSRGYCGCTQDTDCFNQSCDPSSGTCYTPCGPQATCDAGCCAHGPSVDYCEVTAYQSSPGSGGTSGAGSGGSSGGTTGAYGVNAGPNQCVPVELVVDNGDLGLPCDQLANGGLGNCETGEACAQLFPTDGGSWGQCTAYCNSGVDTCQLGSSPCPPRDLCPGSAVCQAFPSGLTYCAPSCQFDAGSCGAGQQCVPASPNPVDLGVCAPRCAGDAECNPFSTHFVCEEGMCHCTENADCGSGQACQVSTGVCYAVCTRDSQCLRGCCASYGGISYCDPGGSLVPVDGGYNPWPVVDNNGLPAIPAPDLVTITFDPWSYADGGGGSYPYQSQVEAYGAWIMSSGWLQEVGASYGVGLGTAQARRISSETPDMLGPVAVEDFITELVASGTVPSPTAATLYMLYVPFDYLDDCIGYGGYHSWIAQSDGGAFTYALICTWDPSSGPAGLAQVEITASHELIEAATDPTFQGWYLNDPTSPWFQLEVGDIEADQVLSHRESAGNLRI